MKKYIDEEHINMQTKNPVFLGASELFEDLGDKTGVVIIDWSTHNSYKFKAIGNISLTFLNPPSSGKVAYLSLEIENGGSFTITYPSMKWDIGIAPALTAVGLDAITFYTKDGGASYTGFLTGNDMK